MCTLEREGDVFVLTFKGSGEHRFNPNLIASINKALDAVEGAEGSVALVTAGEGKFFSNGLDLAWLQKNPGQLLSFMQSFMSLLRRVLSFPVPTVGAVTGHAAAGGFMLALAHDVRVMKAERAVLYLSEVDIGLPLTPGMNAIIRCKMSPSTFRDAVLFGGKFGGRQAEQAGLVDQVCGTVEETVQAAVKKASELGRRKWDRHVYEALKLEMYKDVLEALGSGGLGHGARVGGLAKL